MRYLILIALLACHAHAADVVLGTPSTLTWQQGSGANMVAEWSVAHWTNGVLHPAMTGNTAPAPYAVAANKEYSAEFVAWKAFDAAGGLTAWDNYATAATSAWLRIDLGEAKALTSYTLAIYSSYPAYMPKAWTIHGSQDASAWAQLDAQSGWVTARWGSTNHLFSIGNTGAYRYYELRGVEVNTANEIGIGDWKLYGRIYY